MKFKVGDRVRVVSNVTKSKSKDEYIGKEFIIKNIYDDHQIYGQAYSIGEYCVVYENELELAAFTKADLRNGMVVECRDGDRYLVLNDRLICNNTWFAISQFANDLSGCANKYTIDKVYKTSGYNFDTLFANSYLTLIWEREKPAKQMTVEEIEKALGYKVKIVSKEN